MPAPGAAQGPVWRPRFDAAEREDWHLTLEGLRALLSEACGVASDIQTELVQSPRPPDDRNRLEWHEFAERLYQLTVRRLTPGLLHLPKDIELWSQRLAKIERAAVDALVALDDYGVKRTSTSRKAAIKSTVALWKELAAATT